jgi:energy-coupling factor transporter ATP-binding protein EcfA2
MTAFPIFRKLSTAGYGLYPGQDKHSEGLDVEFESGLTLVLGANGLGKTTLVTMLYRMCTGPYDIPKLAGATELGGIKLDTKKLPAPEQRMFGDRVNDGAETATCTLELTLGEAEIALTRSLANLELLELSVEGCAVKLGEDRYQEVVKEHAGVNTFGDWILVLRHLIFYFEDRRSLVWDPTAQRQLLRLLFLSPASSKEWLEVEQDIRQRDSLARNLQNILQKEERSFSETEEAASTADEARKELARLEKLQKKEQRRLNELRDEVSILSSAKESARLEALKAESEHESAFRDLERRQLAAIAGAFPSSSDTARYLMAQLISDEECLACGSHSPVTAEDLRTRISESRCVVCNSVVPKASKAGARGIAKASKELIRAGERQEAARKMRDLAEAELTDLLAEIQGLAAAVAKRSARIEELASGLPPDEAKLHERRQELATMRTRLETMKRELTQRRKRFSRFIERTSLEILARRDEVQDGFEDFAEGFLLEQCRLVWAPHRDTVGQSGTAIDFPAFDLEMTGADFSTMVRREGPQQVSESQREFIDLAFRMALIQVAGSGGIGSIVIDAPESSLDAVFVTRAADVLIRFSSYVGNRLLITSNLVEGDLIPELIHKGGIESRKSNRVVDLLRIAAPTAATKKLKRDYEKVRSNLFKRAREK